ncbi:hypothetical protein MLD38_014571 [Melastoma candidum]|uniref:Uncharacterized protein n=1 Tax=Melastoma candidum TaxID=119954 RepID=A0ACB9RCJ8_9MYRT|nr:hypothetical protein MLD38_014571 [Melastoma candidum]
MATSDEELQLQLSEAGNQLLLLLQHPPSSSSVPDLDLLPLLDKLEGLLSKIEQSPPESILDTLPPFVKALIDDKLISHSDEEIKVVVASCISEITRITAPEAPYEDHQMKGVFHLIVSSFENLHDKSSRSYAKRTSILETVARVRSCVVMLDLECHSLILEMFQHFLKSVRDYHPKNVVESMVTIMTLIIEESEDVSPELLSCLLSCVRKDSKDVSPTAQALVEMVLANCASILKPCFGELLQTLGSSLDDYNDPITSIFRDADAIGMNHQHSPEEHKVDKHVPPRNDPVLRTPKLRITNMVVQKKESGSVPEKEDRCDRGNRSKSDTAVDNSNVGLVNEDEANLESLRVNKKRKGRQLDGSQNSRKKEVKKLRGNEKEQNNGNLDEEPPSEGNQKASAKALHKGEVRENLSKVAASKGRTEQVGKQSKKLGRKKKRDDSKEVAHHSTELSKDESEGGSDSKAKDQVHSCTKVSVVDSADAKSAITLKISRTINDDSGAVKEKQSKSSSKMINKSEIIRDGSSVKKQKNKKQPSIEKEASETGAEKSAIKQNKKGVSSSKLLSKSGKNKVQPSETPKANSKGKGTPRKKSSDVKGYGMDLVGSKIRVWWPRDKQFYTGVVDSFDPVKKKHKVVYSDGDKEILNLQKEKWELVAEASGSEQVEAPNDGNADGSPELAHKERVQKGMEESAAKEGKKELTSKKDRDGSSGRGKATALKSGQKRSVGKPGKNSKTKSNDPAELSGKKPDSSSRKADEDDDVEEKAANFDEADDDDLLSLSASIKSIMSKGRARKLKELKSSSSGEDKSKKGVKNESVDSDGLDNQKVNSSNEQQKGVYEKADDAAEREEPTEEKSGGVPKKENEGTEPNTGKKRAREA